MNKARIPLEISEEIKTQLIKKLAQVDPKIKLNTALRWLIYFALEMTPKELKRDLGYGETIEKLVEASDLLPVKVDFLQREGFSVRYMRMLKTLIKDKKFSDELDEEKLDRIEKLMDYLSK